MTISSKDGNMVYHLTIILTLTLPHLCQSQPPDYDHDIDLPTTQPLIIAHRGASGVYPEHTSVAFQLAIDQKADTIECDICVTKDLHLVCLHESWMSGTTNVADIFPEDRMNTYFIDDDGRFITDYFSVDFTLEEFKTISLRQPYDYRDQSFNDQYPVMSLHELIDMVQAADPQLGFFPEIKDPNWVNSLDIMQDANTTIEELLVEAVTSRGYVNERSPCFILCFDSNSLLKVADLTPLPIVMTVNSGVSDDDLDFYSTFAYALAVEKDLVVSVGSDNRITEITDLVERAKNVGLRVFPWTTRNEYQYLAFDYEQDPYLEYETLLFAGVDGIISDFPGTYKRYLQGIYCDLCTNSTFNAN